MSDANPSEHGKRQWAMKLSLLVALLMLVGKSIAAYLTGSAAIFSDALESVIHLVATAFVAFSLWYASTPPDTEHPYGHGKIAYFASGFEGSMILFAGLSILYTAGRDLMLGPSVQRLGLGLIITLGLAIINGGLGWYLIRAGRRQNSIVLTSNGQHVLTDMWTSMGVVGGVALVWWTGYAWLDPVVAIGVALNILWTAGRLMRRSARGLMDRADTRASRIILETLEEAVADGWIEGFHQVRHRRLDDQIWIEYHLFFSGDLSVEEAHRRAHHVEDAVDALFPEDRVHVTAHLEPSEHEAAHPEGHVEPEDPLDAAWTAVRNQ